MIRKLKVKTKDINHGFHGLVGLKNLSRKGAEALRKIELAKCFFHHEDWRDTKFEERQKG